MACADYSERLPKKWEFLEIWETGDTVGGNSRWYCLVLLAESKCRNFIAVGIISIPGAVECGLVGSVSQISFFEFDGFKDKGKFAEHFTFSMFAVETNTDSHMTSNSQGKGKCSKCSTRALARVVGFFFF